MKTISLLILCLLIPMIVHAAPFLVCNPQLNVGKYDVEADGIIIATDILPEADGSIRFDMAGTSDGDHILRLRAANIWGWSDWSIPFDFTAGVPQVPAGIGLSGN